MRVGIVGSSGFVGSALSEALRVRGDEVVALRVREDTTLAMLIPMIAGCDAIINLAGATIAHRWDDAYKALLRTSRLDTTQKIVEAIQRQSTPPKVLINASAVGIYDSKGAHDESSQALGKDFLAQLVREWEGLAQKASSAFTRVASLRFGVVYAHGGGAMEKMLPPFKLGLGGRIASGEQMVSWIHREDLIRAILWVLDHPSLSGVFNATAPTPLSNAEQTRLMGRALHRWTIFPLPTWVLTTLFGEGASVMLDSKEVYPKRLLESGFDFRYPTFDTAMEQIAHAQG